MLQLLWLKYHKKITKIKPNYLQPEEHLMQDLLENYTCLEFGLVETMHKIDEAVSIRFKKVNQNILWNSNKLL